jgi:thioesterase domain-containing protein
MAAHFIDEIRTIQPHGPYWLGGYSFGGIVAFEMARQLLEQREDIALLALFDTWAPGYPRVMPLVQRLGLHAEKIRQLDPQQRASYISDRMRSASRRLSRLAGLSSDPHDGERLLDPVRKIGEANRCAAGAYLPRPFAGMITLFRAEGPSDVVGVELTEPTMGWGSLAESGLKVHSIPGTHDAIFREPHVRVLAEKLERYFRA